MIAKSNRSKEQTDTQDLPHLLKVAVSLGRMKQNPIGEILNLWSAKVQTNGCLLIPLHPLQSAVSQQKLQEEYEKTIVEVVNSVGVEINEILNFKHLESQFQFVCGLGPRKA